MYLLLLENLFKKFSLRNTWEEIEPLNKISQSLGALNEIAVVLRCSTNLNIVTSARIEKLQGKLNGKSNAVKPESENDNADKRDVYNNYVSKLNKVLHAVKKEIANLEVDLKTEQKDDKVDTLNRKLKQARGKTKTKEQ